MTGESIKDGLEGLSKIEGFTDVLFNALYWIGVVFILLFVAYLFATLNCYLNKKRRGTLHADTDEFLDD